MTTRLYANQKAHGKKLNKWYENLNAYDLAVSYVPSLRPENGLLPEVIEESRKLMIHCFRPSEQHVEKTKKTEDEEAFVIQNNVSKKFPEFDKPKLPYPKVLPEDEERMKKYWRSLNNGYTEEQFHLIQADKHLKFQKLQSTKNIYKQGLKRAHPYIATKGKLNLMKILREKGYEVGNMYDCGQLVSDLEAVIGGVKVVFKELKPVKGQMVKVMVLQEICILFYHNASKRILGKRKQSFSEGSMFLLEDFHYRFGG